MNLGVATYLPIAYLGLAVANAARIVSSKLLSVGETTTSLDTFLPQLGVFGVVVLVIHLMLNRQDKRDERDDAKDAANSVQKDAEIESLRRQLEEERRAHDHTRDRLIKAVSDEHR